MKCYFCKKDIGNNIMYIRKDIKNAYFCSSCMSKSRSQDTEFKQVILTKDEIENIEIKEKENI